MGRTTMPGKYIGRHYVPATYEAFGDWQENLVGAVIFMSYIAAALFFTSRVVGRIRRQYKSHSATAGRGESTKDMNVFVVLACISFIITSYNMLSFLFLSFSHYCKAHGRPSPSFANASLEAASDALPLIWDWISHSNLFEDFVQAIVKTPQGWWWAQANLLGNMVFTSIIADRFKVEGLPGLASLLALSQILPISLTVNLAILSYMTAARPANAPAVESATTVSTSTASGKSTGTAGAALLQLATVVLYESALYCVPQLRDTTYFMPAVLAIRAMLCVPYLLPTSGSLLAYITITASAVPWLIYGIFKYDFSVDQLLSGINQHPAVRTLSYDVFLSLITVVIFSLISLRDEMEKDTQTEVLAEDKKRQ